MFNNPECTVVSSFTRGGKMYITLELDLNAFASEPTSKFLSGGISLGDFRIEVERGNGNIALKLYYGSIKIAEWSIPEPQGCVNLGEQTFTVLGIKVKIKDIQICVEGTSVCLKAGVYVKNPITGDYNKLGDINVCS